MVAKSGLTIAIEETIKIASHLPNKDNRKLYRKSVYMIFDDQLKANTKLSRDDRHKARDLLKKALKNHEAK